jgi:hypothetical protein
MAILRSIRQIGKNFLLTAMCWSALHGTALAAAAAKTGAETPAAQGGGSGGWIYSYAVVGLCIAIALVAVLRPSSRKDRARTDQVDIHLKVQI